MASLSLRVKVEVEVSEPALILGRTWRGCSLASLGVHQCSERGVPLELGGTLGSHRRGSYTLSVQACFVGNQKCMSISEPFLRPP